MPTTLQLRGGNTADSDLFTGAPKELSVDTEAKELRLHDGSTPGGKVIGGGATSSGMTGVTVTNPGWVNYPHNVLQTDNGDPITTPHLSQYQHAAFFYPTLVTRLAIWVSTPDAASTETYIGLYEQDPVTGGPGDLIHGSAALDVSAVGLVVSDLPAPMNLHGLYWVAMKSDSVTLETKGIWKNDVLLHPLGITSGLTTTYRYREDTVASGPLVASSSALAGTSDNRYRGVGFQ